MDLWIARRNFGRKGVLLPVGNGVMIPLHKMGANQLEEIIDWQLEKEGVPKEERQKVRERAEINYENRLKTNFVSREIRRRLEGHSPLMTKKNGKWTFTK